MGDSRVCVAYRVVHILEVPILLETSFMDTFFMCRLPLEQKIVLYNDEPLPGLAINNLSEKSKNRIYRASDIATANKEPVPCVVGVESKTKTAQRTERTVLVETDKKWLLKIDITTKAGQYSMVDESIEHFRTVL